MQYVLKLKRTGEKEFRELRRFDSLEEAKKAKRNLLTSKCSCLHKYIIDDVLSGDDLPGELRYE